MSTKIRWRPSLDIDGSGVTNADRARMADELMQQWEQEHYRGGEEDGVMAGDLVADLCHWMHSKGMNTEEIEQKLRDSFEVFMEESTPPPKERSQ